MQPTLQALASFQNALREALVQQDWAAIGALDAQCRALIGKAGVSDPALHKPLEESRGYMPNCSRRREPSVSELPAS